MTQRLLLTGVSKSFTLHLRDGVTLPVVAGVSFHVDGSECVVLGGQSGAGKSSILKMVYGNYGVGAGQILITHAGNQVDMASADARLVMQVRRQTLGYVSQFLRAIPRVAAIDVAAEPLVRAGVTAEAARERAAALFARLNLPERLWSLPPATFSGGEQQRVNIARGFLPDLPVLLLDEPTASLDARNRQVVIDMIAEKKANGTALLGIFHDADVREAVADRIIDVSRFATAAVAA
ncbi:MAG: phosphonate C-P lyase system protein PhnL [Minwuia sp.]|nr:phosphonate C-P lyase system protein PhnL [Minwuia sp.]